MRAVREDTAETEDVIVAFFDELAEARKQAIRLTAEAKSIEERISEITAEDGIDRLRARTKLRHVRAQLVEVQCEIAERETRLESMRMGL